MMKFALALALAFPTCTAFAQAPNPGAVSPSPYTATRLGHRPRNVRVVHCEKKADSVGVQGKAREIYMRKCTRG